MGFAARQSREQNAALSTETSPRTPAPQVPLLVAAVALVLALCSSTLYKLADRKPHMRYHGFVVADFSSSEACAFTDSESAGFPDLRRVATWSADGSLRIARCSSGWFASRGNFIEFEFAGYRAPNVSEVFIAVERRDAPTEKFVPPPGKRIGDWRLAGLRLPRYRAGEEIRVHLVDQDPGSSWLSMRTRLNQYQVNPWSLAFRRFAAHGKSFLKLLLASSLAVCVLSVLSRINRGRELFVAAFVFSGIVHFRSEAFFYHDDLQFIERIATEGLRAILSHHHEHVIPLFNVLLYAEFSLFGSWYPPYLLVTLLIHSSNCVLLWGLLRRLSGSEVASAATALVFFGLSWLQLEALQWLTMQSLLLSNVFRLLAYGAAVDILEEKAPRAGLRLFLYALAAQLCFAGGITVALEAVLFAVCFASCRRKRLRRLIWPAISALGVGAVLYILTLSGASLVHERVSLQDPADLLGLARFYAVASQYGALVRSLHLDAVLPAVNTPFFERFGLARDIWWSAFGAFVSLLLLAFALVRGRTALWFWIFGQAVLVATLLPPGVGRLHWGGVEYGLKLRYHAAAIIALAFLLFPLIRSISARPRLAAPLLIVWVWLQIDAVSIERRYIDHGPLYRRYAAQLNEWEMMVGDVEKPEDYYQLGAPRAGQYPLPYYESINEPRARDPWDLQFLLTRHLR